MNAKHYNRSLNALALQFLRIEGLSYLSDDFIESDPETKEWVKRHPKALQRRAVLLNYQLRDSIVIPTADEAHAQQESSEDEDEEEE